VKWCDNEKSEMLKKLFGGNENVDENERDAKEIIRKENGELVGSDSIVDGFKRMLMSRLRKKGFDASEYQLHAIIVLIITYYNLLVIVDFFLLKTTFIYLN
jgi:hypothetical protein